MAEDGKRTYAILHRGEPLLYPWVVVYPVAGVWVYPHRGEFATCRTRADAEQWAKTIGSRFPGAKAVPLPYAGPGL